MAIQDHIIELDDKGWMSIHPVRCSGSLLECVITQLCREMPGPPEKKDGSPVLGRFWAYPEKQGNRVFLHFGAKVSPVIEGTSRRIGDSYRGTTRRPD